MVEISRSLFDIGDELITYDKVLEYIKKELVGKEVTLYDKNGDKITGEVMSIFLHPRTFQFVFYIENDHYLKYIVDENKPIKWKTTIDRKITKEDPYGEED